MVQEQDQKTALWLDNMLQVVKHDFWERKQSNTNENFARAVLKTSIAT